MLKKPVAFAVLTSLSLVLLWQLMSANKGQSTKIDASLMPASRNVAQVQVNTSEVGQRPSQRTNLVQIPTLEEVTRYICMQLKNGKFVDQSANTQLKHNDVVQFTVLSDEDDILHIHGYDFSQKLRQGERSQFVLKMRLAGRFEIELHSNKQVVGQLEVFPR